MNQPTCSSENLSECEDIDPELSVSPRLLSDDFLLHSQLLRSIYTFAKKHLPNSQYNLTDTSSTISTTFLQFIPNNPTIQVKKKKIKKPKFQKSLQKPMIQITKSRIPEAFKTTHNSKFNQLKTRG